MSDDTRIVALNGTTEIRGAQWTRLDFTGSRLGSLRFFDCSLEDCVFDRAFCQDWRLWGTSITNASFISADLRKSALGGVIDQRRNTFHRVNFDKADLSHTVYKAATFSGCSFEDTKLSKIDFQSSSFRDCCFSGELEDVLFYRKAFGGDGFPENEMHNVNFARATLRFVEFRGLDLDTVALPTSGEHIILPDYRKTLESLVAAFAAKADKGSRGMAAYFQVMLKWAGPNQRRGVVNARDVVEIGGHEALDLVRAVVAGDAHGIT